MSPLSPIVEKLEVPHVQLVPIERKKMAGELLPSYICLLFNHLDNILTVRRYSPCISKVSPPTAYDYTSGRPKQL